MGFAGTFLRRSCFIILAALVLYGCAGGSSAVKKEKADSLAKLQKVDVKESDDSLGVIILTDKPVSFTTVRVSDPPRMVVELAGTDIGDVKDIIKVNQGPVEYIAPSQAPDASHIARLEIGLTGPVNSKTAQSGEAINIIFEKPKAEAKAEAPSEPVAGAAPETPAAEEKPVEAESPPPQALEEKAEPEKPEQEPAEEAPAAKAKAGKPAPSIPEASRVSRITYEKGKNGYEVKIEGNGKFGNTKSFKLGKDRIVIDLLGVSASQKKTVIDVKGKPLNKIRMARHERPDKKVRVVLDLGAPADYDVISEGKSLLVEVTPPGTKFVSKEGKKRAAKAETAETKAGAKAEIKAEAKPAEAKPAHPGEIYITKAEGRTILSSKPISPETAAAPAAGRAPQSYVETGTKIYTGGRISFDIQDAELDQVVKLLADVAGLNLIMDPAEVKGKVTLKLDNVPWDQALDILLKIYNLDKVIEGNVLRVASKTKLDEEKRRDLLQIAEEKKLEQQAQDLYTKTFKVNYTTATELEPAIKKVLSPRGDATANPNTNELIITDIMENIEKAGDVIALLDKEVNQIMIEARILTVDVGYSQSLGVSWGLRRNTNTANPNFGFAQGPTSSVNVAGQNGATLGAGSEQPVSPGPNGSHGYQLNLPAELAAAAGGVVGAMSWGSLLKDINLDLTIQALEAINKAEVLAAPKVFTLENQSANIVSGTTLYVQTTSAAGTKPEPLNANLSLTVVPRVTGNNYIMMQVTATNNQPITTPPPGSTAAISTQAVTTNVLVKDGDTIVLGGIYTKTKSHDDSHIPLLGRIPIIKYLFSTNKWADTTSELLIFITPKLVKQSQAQKV